MTLQHRTETAAIEEIVLSTASGATATVLDHGATLRDLKVPAPGGGVQRVVLGFGDIELYRTNPTYFGATAGRHANRIRAGRFSLEGSEHALSLNEAGRNHLHGGFRGFSHRPWRVVSRAANAVTLELVSPAGEEGYPGTVTARCTYTLLDPGTLRVEMTAETDAPTIVNMAHHSYFTLEPGGSVRDLDLAIHAGHYTPVDETLIPTGEIAPVIDTPYDFRTARPVRWWGEGGAEYDINFVLDRHGDDGTTAEGLAHAATLRSPRSGLSLDVWTTEPGLQVFDGGFLGPEPAGLDGTRHFPHAGLCLETQRFPDGPNQVGFPSPALAPGGLYRHVTEYRFSLHRPEA